MLFPILEAVHVMGLALSVGSIVLVDLASLGVFRRPAQNLRLCAWIGFALMFVTGAALFLSNMPRYVRNPGFLVKMGLLTLALRAHVTIHRKATRFAAVFWLILWSGVVISAKAIADLDI